ncbi:tetratricopeptide repeat protein [Priestia aryabhattai]
MNGYTRESYNSANYSNSYSNVNAFNSLVDQIMISTENRMWSKVINLCNQAIEYNDQEPMIYVFKANALQNQEKYQAAISFYKIALTYNWNPHSSDLWNYALCYMELGKYSEAIPLVERVISIEGELPNCISHLAWCYESIGDYRTADDYWERLERIDPYNEMLQQRKQAMRVGNQYVSKSDAAVGACGICAILECLFDCC